ncbi:MAG: hypothetical protein ACHQIG_10300 [Acidimicrobiia bacterium]
MRTRPFDALGWSFVVVSDDDRIVEYVTELYAGLADLESEGIVHEYRIEESAPGEHDLTVDGERLGADGDPSALVATLVHDVNRRAIDTTELLAVHAGGVVGAEGAVVLPAHMEAGKTTLTAGLVRAGFGYLTDEAVAFDWDTLDITAYAKPLSIDPGAWTLFPELEPGAPFEGTGYKANQWQVPAGAIGAAATTKRAHARYVVFPRYRADARTELEPIGRAEAVVELARNTFHFRTHGRRALDALARLVPSLDCYRMDVGDLGTAVALIGDLAGGTT